MTKVCLICKNNKPLEEFHPRPGTPCGYYPYCRLCDNKKKNESYHKRMAEDPNYSARKAADSRKYRKKYPKKIATANACRRKKGIKDGTIIEGWVAKKYTGIPCLDCWNVFPFCVMDFDHRPEEVKEFNISRYSNQKASPKHIARVEKEIAKCDLICANCHRVRTFITRKK